MRRQIVHSKHQVKLTLKHQSYKYDIETHPHDPKLPAVFVFSGNRCSGKTLAGIALWKNFESKHYTTRTFLLCPTRESNHTFDELHTLTKEDTCEDPKYFVLFLKHVLEEIKKDWKVYELRKCMLRCTRNGNQELLSTSCCSRDKAKHPNSFLNLHT